MNALPAPVNRPSFNETFTWSFEWTKGILFPFDFNRWLHLAFFAFLMLLGGSGGGSGFSFPNSSGTRGGPGGPGMQEQVREAGRFMEQYIGLIALGALALVLVIFILVALLKWLGARGQFMFLHALVHNDVSVSDSWSRYKVLGNSLFRAYYALFLIVFIPVLLVLGILFAMFYSLATGTFDESGFIGFIILAVAISLLIIVPLVLIVSFLHMCIDDLVVPVMLRDGCTFRPAARRVWNLARSIKGDFAMYVVLRLVVAIIVGMANGMLVLLACCLTCGIALLPVVGQMPMLPGLVFRRYFSLAWLQQLGPEWAVFPQPTGNLPAA